MDSGRKGTGDCHICWGSQDTGGVTFSHFCMSSGHIGMMEEKAIPCQHSSSSNEDDERRIYSHNTPGKHQILHYAPLQGGDSSIHSQVQATAEGQGETALAFLLRCREKDIIPKFTEIKTSVKSPSARRIAKRAGLALVQERIHDKRRALDHNAKCLKSIRLLLASTLSPLDWEYIDKATAAQADILLRKSTERQTKKFGQLSTEKQRIPPFDQKRLVINLTDEALDEPTMSVLSKGLNFAPAPRSITYNEIMGGIEQAIRKLPKEAAEDVRSDVSLALKRAVLPKPNITTDERKALVSLRRNPDIKILPADKGNATVIMKSEEYHQKIMDILQDASYRTLLQDPTDALARKTVPLIKKAGLPAETERNLRPPAEAPPRLYGLPKIHKDGIPLRPIVSAINSPTYNLAKYLTGLLSPHVGKCEHHIRNSSHLISILDKIHLDPSDIMVSLDVVSLFTKVPLKLTFQLLEAIFDKRTIDLINIALTTTNNPQSNHDPLSSRQIAPALPTQSFAPTAPHSAALEVNERRATTGQNGQQKKPQGKNYTKIPR
ncbi:hypothetical protein J437_LFUL004394 [Ladona fulva]|uniref:Reverse transcriptase domain-containing protein n=1 Tax=Ladona fulva TaxID=123851 RepID=A0A8K0NZ22_LADFU|nr:hypothetical protein J437_LFUL004394 [Ladona fulva]